LSYVRNSGREKSRQRNTALHLEDASSSPRFDAGRAPRCVPRGEIHLRLATWSHSWSRTASLANAPEARSLLHVLWLFAERDYCRAVGHGTIPHTGAVLAKDEGKCLTKVSTAPLVAA
jgi:hypothetical protein